MGKAASCRMDMIVKHSQGLRRQQVYDMKTFTLNGTWSMLAPDGNRTEGKIPGSVYSFLLDAGKMEDPFYRDNEFKALDSGCRQDGGPFLQG